MNEEKQLETIKRLIDNGELTEFGQIFDYVPNSWMRSYLQTGYQRISRLEKDPGDLKALDMIILAERIKADPVKIAKIVITQVLRNNNKKKKKK